MVQKEIKTDVLIIGGGMAGLTLAGVLGRSGVNVVCVDRADPADQLKQKYDGRTTAISFASSRVLNVAGVWEGLQEKACPILDIRVADGNAPMFLHFSSDTEADGNPFGWIIENNLLRRTLFENVKDLPDRVTHLAPVEITDFTEGDFTAGVVLSDGTTVTAPLMIGADGRHSATRKFLEIDETSWSYDQMAIVCNVTHTLDHENVAVEHFMPQGPFAILPMINDDQGRPQSSVVWTVEKEDANRILNLSSYDANAELQNLFGDHLGDVSHATPLMGYPLSLMHAKKYIGTRTALMAEAAHVIHPIAGQGLNLSMRDVAVLAELITDHMKAGGDIGAQAFLESYENWRRTDTLLMTGFTDVLNKLFSNDIAGVAEIRALGLGIIEKIHPLKVFFAKQAMGTSGKSPRIVSKGKL